LLVHEGFLAEPGSHFNPVVSPPLPVDVPRHHFNHNHIVTA
jgi:hypothetical protein